VDGDRSGTATQLHTGTLCSASALKKYFRFMCRQMCQQCRMIRKTDELQKL